MVKEIEKQLETAEERIRTLENELGIKEKLIKSLQTEIEEKNEKLKKVEDSINKLANDFHRQDNLMNSYKESLKLKDDQIQTMKDSLELKDHQIQTYEENLKNKDDKIANLMKRVDLKEEELNKLRVSPIENSDLKEKDEKLKEFQKEIEILNNELSKADIDIETLEIEIEKLKEAQISSSNSKIIDFTNTKINESEIIDKMREILQNALHNVMIVVPNITDLQDLYLYEVKSSVSLKISCFVNPGMNEHSELLEEFESLDNISLRAYEREDRYVLVRDGEELLFGIRGKSENNNMVIHTKDPKHIKLLNALALEGWLQSRKI